MTPKRARPKAVPSVQIDNERVIVTEWRFPIGAETSWHIHAFDYVVVPQTDGRLTLETDDGQTNADLQSGVSYFRNKGVAHNVINASGHEFVFLEIELKQS